MRVLADPIRTHRAEDGRDLPLLVWRLPAPALAISSAVLGGGLGECLWVVNATVPMSYDRDDPAGHLVSLATGLGLTGRGVGLLTGVDVADLVAAEDGGVRLWATVGLGGPIQAAAPPADPPRAPARSVEAVETMFRRVGTVNIVAWVPARLSAAALVNAVATVTEAKSQAIHDLGLAATGTATDAVCVLCPPDGVEAPYGGPRSEWGRPLARATHRAVLDGGAKFLAGGRP
jgi:adenosylcobinamide amidohydrolase